MIAVLPLALQKIENEYLLFGAAGLVSLVAFVGLILVPALSSYGRVWEKAAAGVLSALRPRRPGPGRRRDRPGDRLLLQRHRQSAPRQLASSCLAGDNGAMPAASKGTKVPANKREEGTLDALSEAVESGAGLPAVARAAAKVLDASVALIDRSSAVLAVAGASPDQEQQAACRGRGGDPGRAAGRRQRRRRAALPRRDAARADDRPHGDDAAGAGAGALALAGVGERGGGGRLRRRRAGPRGDRPRRHPRPRRRARRRPRAGRRGADPARDAACGADRRVARPGADPGPAGPALACPGLAGQPGRRGGGRDRRDRAGRGRRPASSAPPPAWRASWKTASPAFT